MAEEAEKHINNANGIGRARTGGRTSQARQGGPFKGERCSVGRRRRRGTTVNVFQSDVTWNNDANLSKQAPPRPRSLEDLSELPNLS